MHKKHIVKNIYDIQGLSGLPTLDIKASILENANTLIGLPPYLAGQRSSTSP